MRKELKAGLMVVVIFFVCFTSIQPTVSAFEKEVHDFNRIWYDDVVGFNKNGQGTLVLAITYTNNTLRDIDYCHLDFTKDPFYLGITFADELYVLRDDEGNIIYQEPRGGYIYLRKIVVQNLIPDNVKSFASRNLNYSTIQYDGDTWYRITVPDFNSLYEWKEFNMPKKNEKWYTWGNSSSIEFTKKAMYVELTKDSNGGIELSFDHPSDNSGQLVNISKAFLASKGITKPVFEWGDKKPWKMISYTENDTHYFISPEHFSFVGIHESSSGNVPGIIIDRNMSTGDLMTLADEQDGSLAVQQTEFTSGYYFILVDGDYWTSMWQTFKEENIHLLTKVRVLLTTGDTYVDVICTIKDRYGNPVTSVTRTFSSAISESWQYFDFPDVYLESNRKYYLHLKATDSMGHGDGYWRAKSGNPYSNGRSQWGSNWDHAFELYGYNLTVERIASANTERNILDTTLSYDFNTSTKYRNIELYPDDEGDSTDISYATGEGAYPVHWDCVQEATANDVYNSVYTDNTDWETDLYAIYGIINNDYGLVDNITVYYRGAELPTSTANGHIMAHYKNSGTQYDGSDVSLTTSWTTYSYSWDGVNLSFSSLLDLQIGVSLKKLGGSGTARCTQVYVDAEYHLEPGLVVLKIPVSESVNGIDEVLNQTSGIAAYEVSSYYDLENNTYYFDAGNSYVYIGTTNLSSGQHINWSVNCTYGSDFEVVPPYYLRSGDNFAFRGVILDKDGNAIDGYISTTQIISTNNTVVAQAKWNCSFGNYECDMATTQIVPGLYTWEISFVDVGTGLLFKEGGPLYLDVAIGDDPSEGPHASAHLYYSFFDLNTGTGLNDNFFKFYISPDTTFNEGDRIKGGVRATYLGQTLYFRIKDFFGNQIYPEVTPNGELYDSVYINEAETYIDVGINMRQFRVKNSNSSTVYFIIRRDATAQQLGRWIPPYEETELFLLNGSYNITVQYYWNNNATLRATVNDPSFDVSSDIFYWISGRSLDDVVDEVEEEGTWVYYTIFDMNSGSQLGDDYYKMYMSEDETFTEEDRIKGGKYKTLLGRTLHFKVLDYWDNKIYPVSEPYENITVISTKSFLDLGLPLNQFLIKNTNRTLIYFKMTDGNFSDPVNQTWYNRWVPPDESIELFVRSSLYNISIEYYNPYDASFIKYDNSSNFSVYTDTFFVIQGYNSRIYFNIYNANEGLGIPFENLKIYVNNLRLPNKYLDVFIGQNLTVLVKDYYDFELYNSSFNISEPLNFVDLPLLFYSYKFSNMYNDYYVVGLQKNGSSTWWEKIVTPYETIEFIAPMGNYSIRVYNISLAYAEFESVVNSSKAFVIEAQNVSTNITLVLEGQQTVISTITGYLTGFNASTSSLLYNVLSDIYYSNQTMQSINEQFRIPHDWYIPGLNYSLNDIMPPVSTISATSAFGGGINVKWTSTDDYMVSFCTIYYRVDAGSWRTWKSAASPVSSDNFLNEITLENGTVYWFKCIGVDINGNIEAESDTNVCNITYMVMTRDNQSLFGNIPSLIYDYTLGSIHFWAIIILLTLTLIVLAWRRRKVRDEIIRYEKRRRKPMWIEEEL